MLPHALVLCALMMTQWWVWYLISGQHRDLRIPGGTCYFFALFRQDPLDILHQRRGGNRAPHLLFLSHHFRGAAMWSPTSDQWQLLLFEMVPLHENSFFHYPLHYCVCDIFSSYCKYRSRNQSWESDKSPSKFILSSLLMLFSQHLSILQKLVILKIPWDSWTWTTQM